MMKRIIDILFVATVIGVIAAIVYPVLKPKKYTTIIGRKYEGI